MGATLDNLPAFNNRQASYRLIEWDGRKCIVYRLPGDQPYAEEVIEALRITQKHPCEFFPSIFDIEPRQIIAEYLDGYVPLSKAGVTSVRYRLLGRKPKRFKRHRLRADLQDMATHFDAFVEQLQALGTYLRRHGLWHDDVIPQNVMWNRTIHRMKLIDISALCPFEYVRNGRRNFYGDGRTAGVYQADHRVNRQYIQNVFLQDLDPLPVVLLRKLGIGIRK